MTDDYSREEVLRILDLNERTLRACLRATGQSAATKTRRFSFSDLILLKTTKGLSEAGIPMRQIRKNLESLRRQLPDDPSLGRVKIYADGKRMVVWDGTAHWQPSSGQFLFHFDAGSLPGPGNVRSLPRRGRIPATAAQMWYERALELHQESPEEARRAYEQAIERDPSLVQAHLDLGRLHQDAGDLRRATACYRAAIRHAPDQAAGYVYLAEAFLVQGRRRRAIVAYRRALERDAQLLHVHRRLGQLYEAEGQPVLALRHYAAEFKRQKKDRRHDRGGFPGGKPPKKQR